MASSSVLTAVDACKSKRHDSIVKFIKETGIKRLDLQGAKLGAEELKFLLKYLPSSQINELNLAYNNLKYKMKDLAEVLVNTEIRKLNVSGCKLTNQDVFHLMEVLKDTKLTELQIYYNNTEQFDEEEENRFVSFMLESNLRIFDFDFYELDYYSRGNVFQALLLNTSITKLNVVHCADDNILSLFSNLHLSSLTDLAFEDIDFNEHLWKTLSQNLGNSKLEKLDLSSCKVDDYVVDILVEGLVQSKIVDLDLSLNNINGSNTLGLRLKDTCIATLYLNNNAMEQHGIFLSPDCLRSSMVTELDVRNCKLSEKLSLKLMESLRFSKVTKLDISFNNLRLPAIVKFAQILKDTNLRDVDFSGNNLTPDASIILGESMKLSQLSHVNLSYCFKYPDGGTLLPLFLAETKGSAIKSVDFQNNELDETGAKMLAVHLRGTTLTHLNLSFNEIGNGFASLAEHLKFTAITYMCLYDNKITDEGAEALARHLSETQLISLTLSENDITDCGAKALAHSLKNSNLLCLQLKGNKIGNDGVEALARGAENTFITVLNVPSEEGNVNLLVESVLWENKTSVHCLVSTFKQIAPQTVDGNFSFDGNLEHQSADTFLENCLELCMNILQKPSAVGVLLEEKSISLSKDQIISLISEKFPEQFCQFVASRVEADVKQQVNLLKSAESKGLNKVAELLLLNRPSYLIDENKGILHPFVYKMLNKHNYPLYNLDVEPDGKIKIINYFTEHSDIEGASDVLRLLHGKRKQ